MNETQTAVTPEQHIAGRLAGYCRAAFPGGRDARVQQLARISDGWETDVYSFTLGEGTSRQELILRVYPGDDAVQKSAREFAVMGKLHELGYPVPRVLCLEADPSVLGKPFVVMEKIAGRSLGALLQRSWPWRRRQLMALFCGLFARLHALDWRAFSHDPALDSGANAQVLLEHKLVEAREMLHTLGSRAFDPVLGWLLERSGSIRAGRVSLVHWDFHPYNILVRRDGAAFVIDWGNAEVLDPRADLAWSLVLMGTYGHPAVRKEVIRGYERAAGLHIDDLDYFVVAMCLRRLFSIVVSLSAGAAKLGMRPGAEAMMVQYPGHIRCVYDLLRERTGIALPEVEQLLARLG